MNYKKTEKLLLDKDGSCRDININNLGGKDVSILFSNLLNMFTLTNASNKNGDDVKNIIKNKNKDLSKEIVLHSLWENEKCLIKNLQVYICKEKDNTFFIELTFFPEDINHNGFAFKKFISFIKKIFFNINIKEYYVRYENASWKFGDVSKNSGIIFSNRDYSLEK